MNKSVRLALAASVVIAPITHAAWGFRYQFSTDNGATFGSQRSISVLSGNATLRIRVVAYADPGTIASNPAGSGLAIAFFYYKGSEKFTALNAASIGVTPLGQNAGQLTMNGNSYITSGFSGTSPILGSTSPTSWASQTLFSSTLMNFSPSFGGTPQLEWVIREGGIRVSALGGARTIVFSNNTRETNLWYRDPPNGGSPFTESGSPEGQATDIPGFLTVIPTPSSLTMLAALAPLHLRRRRPVPTT